MRLSHPTGFLTHNYPSGGALWVLLSCNHSHKRVFSEHLLCVHCHSNKLLPAHFVLLATLGGRNQ